jgi:hypothetical protein
MKYSLRSLMVAVLVGPPLLAVGWWAVQSAIAPVERAEFGSATPEELDEAIRLYDKYIEAHP